MAGCGRRLPVPRCIGQTARGSSRLRILFISAEVAPFAKTGGLADVAGALPKALAALGHDVRIATPAYARIEHAAAERRWDIAPHPVTLRVPVGGGLIPAGVLHTRLPGARVPVYFLAERSLFGRDGIYGYDDDPYRFAFFGRAALDLAVAALGWRPDIVHAHDWHAAAAVFWLATAGSFDARYARLPTVLTVHNLQHQGRTSRDILRYLGIGNGSLREEGYGEVNLLARGLYHATMISTVSPTYAREILTREGGAGLDGLLAYRHDVHGIINGIDADTWNPATDPRLAAPYDADRLAERGKNKRALQARVRLPLRDDVPLVGMVSRLDNQKGLDITGHVVHLLLNHHAGEAQFVVLGAGAAAYEDMFRHLGGYHQYSMSAVFGHDSELAPLIYAGSDIFVMPSRWEPCGLGQLLAMRYGSVPVVRATGGLADTVHDGVTGFTFRDYSAEAFWEALRRALVTYRHDPLAWAAMQREGMRRDSSWAVSARAYEQLYEWAVARVRGGRDA
jgi:starch synthase